ncbi:hypothetical protein DFP77_107146 [Marinomonas foliarum]|uniref:Uncharacterized protein n=1 Tax=Marinomonas foliarum TaxID=491950 RepID=A0A369AFI9_9GAMM|nr:hypothetical protein DFP77_107146 [Marinomonas foliarum]
MNVKKYAPMAVVAVLIAVAVVWSSNNVDVVEDAIG